MNRRQWTVTPYDRDLVQPRCWLLVGEQERVPTVFLVCDADVFRPARAWRSWRLSPFQSGARTRRLPGAEHNDGEDQMNVHFNDTRSADAPAGTLFEVITDYPSYPDFNLALIHVTVISQDDTGAEFVADRKFRIGKQVRAYGRYERDQDFVVGRADLRGIVVGLLDLDHPSRGCASFHAADRRLSAHGAGARPGDEAVPEEALLRHQRHTLHLGDGTAGVGSKDLGTSVIFQSCWPRTRVLAGTPGGSASLRNRVG